MKTLRQALFDVTIRLPIQDKSVNDRLTRAYDIVRSLGSGYSIIKGATEYRVYRASTSLFEDNSVEYIVDSEGCNCPDAPRARANLCKHKIATLLMEEMEAE